MPPKRSKGRKMGKSEGRMNHANSGGNGITGAVARTEEKVGKTESSKVAVKNLADDRVR